MNAIQFFADKNCSETVAPLDIGYRPVGAELFQLEMFLVDIGNEKDAWCGSLQNLSDGEKHYFKGWSELVANLQNILTPFAQLKVLKALLPTEETTDPRSDASGSAANELPSFSEPLEEEKIMDTATDQAASALHRFPIGLGRFVLWWPFR